MELDIPIAIPAQRVSLTGDERRQRLPQLESLAKDPNGAGADQPKSQRDPRLWTLRLSPQMPVLVRAEGSRLRVLAIATRDQLLPYLTPESRWAA